MTVVLIVLLALLVVLALWAAVAYNGLVRLRNLVDENWSGIDVQLTRRHDLIPNLVETVKGYASHEEGVLTAVTEARARAVSAGDVEQQARAEAGLSAALRSLFAVVEDYPELKADANFRELQAELTRTETAVADARQRYNAAVRLYETKRQSVPTNLIANTFGFASRPYFEIEDPGSRDPVRVEF